MQTTLELSLTNQVSQVRWASDVALIEPKVQLIRTSKPAELGISSSSSWSQTGSAVELDRKSHPSLPENKLGVFCLAGTGLSRHDDGLAHLQDLHVPVRLVSCRATHGGLARSAPSHPSAEDALETLSPMA